MELIYLFSISDLATRLGALGLCNATSKTSQLEMRRGMAENRFYPIKGASNETGITQEVRDLIRNVKHAENIETWEREKGAPEPITFEYLKPTKGDIDNDQYTDMTYYPHRGEDMTQWNEEEPSLVLLVERVQPLHGQPW